MEATARVITGRGIRARAVTLPQGVRVMAGADERRDLYKPMRVTPETAQALAWVTPGNVVEYRIVTNLEWIIE